MITIKNISKPTTLPNYLLLLLTKKHNIVTLFSSRQFYVCNALWLFIFYFNFSKCIYCVYVFAKHQTNTKRLNFFYQMVPTSSCMGWECEVQKCIPQSPNKWETGTSESCDGHLPRGHHRVMVRRPRVFHNICSTALVEYPHN